MATALSPYANGQSTAQAKTIHAMQHPREKTVYNFAMCQLMEDADGVLSLRFHGNHSGSSWQ